MKGFGKTTKNQEQRIVQIIKYIIMYLTYSCRNKHLFWFF